MMLRTLICFLSCVFATDSHINAIMEDIFRSIERTLAFYESNKVLITLDDVFALRLLEGQILVMNNQLLGSSGPASKNLPSNILPRLTTVYQYSRNLSSAALNLLYRNLQWRSVAKSYIYQWPWTFAASYRHLDPSLKWPADTYKSSVNEYSKYEELCFAELMKSGFERDCSITGVCSRVMFTRGQNLRDIEQQLLYTLLAEQSGCVSELNLRAISSGSVEKWQAELCTNIFFTVSDSILKNGNIVPLHLEGIFLNMALLCPLVGYMEFLHIDWLRQILSWQTSSGCWSSARHLTEYVMTRPQSADKAVPQEKEEASDKHYPLKAQANSSVGDFMIKRDGMKRLQEFDSERIEEFLRPRHRRELADAKQNRTTGIRKEKFQYGVTLMTTVFVRQRSRRNKGAERTKEQLGFGSERLLLTETSDRVHSSLPLPDGCVAPFTATAIGALSQYLRFCLLAPLSRINPVDYLFGTNYILSQDKLFTNAGEAGLPVMVYTTQKSPNTAAVVGFGDRNLDHNFAEKNIKNEVKEKIDRERFWADSDSAKVIDENNENDEDGGHVKERDEEDDVDYSYAEDEVIKVVDAQDFKGKGPEDQRIQDGGYDSYYDDTDDDNGGDQPMAWRFDHDRSVKLSRSSSQAMAAVDSRFDGKTYAVLLGVMFLFVWFLYKSFHKRRTGFLYGYSRWK